MNLFHKDLTNLEYRDIEDFCRLDLPEGVRLDYKRQLSNNSPEEQVSKAVSAFANTQGGVLLYGVGTKGNSNRPDWPSDGMPSDPDFERRITRWCIEHISPPVVPMVGYVANPDEYGKAFAVVRVELSMLTPHTVERGERIYVRRADNSDPLPATFNESELLRDHRQRALAVEAEHTADLRERINFSPQDGGRSQYLLVAPEFSSSDAIAMRAIDEVPNRLRSAGFKVGTIRSYSNGLITADPPGWKLAVTNRGSLAVAFLHASAGGQPGEPIDLTGLLGWSNMAVDAVRILSDAAGYWGSYRIKFAANVLHGLSVTDSGDGGAMSYGPCIDPRIKIRIDTSALEVREDPLRPAERLFQRMLWAVGQHDRMWTPEQTRQRLVSVRR